MGATKIDIVITDDHKLFRKGIAALLEDLEMVNNIYEAGNGEELLRLLKETKPLPDLILLDLNMPEMDGFETTKQLKKHYPEVKIIILTMEDDEQFILHLVNEGVNGYLNKSADTDEVELAIEKVIRMDFYFPDEVSKLIFSNLKNFGKSKIKRKIEFSNQEKKVLELLCHEKTTGEIAKEMELGKRTIETYRKNMLEKTGARNMAGLIIYAIKNKLIEI